jgi:membrane protein implicated in regulation of membrane protease activity
VEKGLSEMVKKYYPECEVLMGTSTAGIAHAAIVATILDFVDVSIIWQVLVFLVVSLVGVLFIRRFLTRFKTDRSTRTNIDAIIGEKCVVTEKIDNFAGCGLAKVEGPICSARGVMEDDVFEPGEVLVVVAIEGVKLICKKVS